MNIYCKELFDKSPIEIYASTKEVGLIHMYEPEPGIFIAESPNAILRAIESGYEPLSALCFEKMLDTKAVLSLPDIPIYIISEKDSRDLLEFKLTSGILCAFRRKPNPDYREIIKNAKRIAVLEGVVNPTNVGAIFRSAAALNMDAVLLSPACSDPLYRRSIRVSVGNVFLIPWAFIGFNEEAWRRDGVNMLHECGFKTAAMALRDRTISITDEALRQTDKLALIVGAEGDGLCDETISNSDFVVKIPMSAGVDSLNVATAAAIAFWELGNKCQ